MALYQLHYTGKIIIQHMADGSQRQIPLSNDNGDYHTFLEWSAVPGNTPDPADPEPPPDPQEAADGVTLTSLRTTYQTLIDGLDGIQASRAALDADAAALQAIALSGTLVQTQAQLQTVLRKLGTDLGTMIGNTDKLARGSEALLQTMRVLVRRQGGS